MHGSRVSKTHTINSNAYASCKFLENYRHFILSRIKIESVNFFFTTSSQYYTKIFQTKTAYSTDQGGEVKQATQNVATISQISMAHHIMSLLPYRFSRCSSFERSRVRSSTVLSCGSNPDRSVMY
jgi:hypothetical protein